MKKYLIQILTVINTLVQFAVLTFAVPDTVALYLNNPQMTVTYVGSKWELSVFLVLPLVLAAIFTIYTYAQQKGKITNKNQRIERIVIPLIIVIFAVLGWLFMVNAVLTPPALGAQNALSVPVYICVLFGALIIVGSNYFGKLSPNMYFGIRLPWTLKSETVWRKTHRLGGYLGVLSGFLMILFGALGGVLHLPMLAIIGVFVCLLLLLVPTTIYAYVLYKKEQDEIKKSK